MADMTYGYCIACKPLIDEYNKAMKSNNNDKINK
jgi:hypothetical protein